MIDTLFCVCRRSEEERFTFFLFFYLLGCIRLRLGVDCRSYVMGLWFHVFALSIAFACILHLINGGEGELHRTKTSHGGLRLGGKVWGWSEWVDSRFEGAGGRLCHLLMMDGGAKTTPNSLPKVQQILNNILTKQIDRRKRNTGFLFL